MAYEKPINVANPGLIMILLDQSQSMAELYRMETQEAAMAMNQSQSIADPDDEYPTKADVAAMAVNQVISELVTASSGGKKDNCYVGVVGYGRKIDLLVGGMISKVKKSSLEIIEVTKEELDNTGELSEKTISQPIWVKPKADNGTPMAEAMESAYRFIERWCQRYPDNFPPVVINITDGVPNDMQMDPGDGSRTMEFAKKLMNIETTDGKLLLFNAHISNALEQELILPHTKPNVDDYAEFLFDISSELPDRLRREAQSENLPAYPGARAFVYNAQAETLIKFLVFGSKRADGP